MKSSKISLKSTDLVCLECGNVSSIIRKSSKSKKISHIKDLWCYRCMKTTKNYEVVDIDKFMWRNSNDEIELFVKELVMYGKPENKKRTNRVLKKILEKRKS